MSNLQEPCRVTRRKTTVSDVAEKLARVEVALLCLIDLFMEIVQPMERRPRPVTHEFHMFHTGLFELINPIYVSSKERRVQDMYEKNVRKVFSTLWERCCIWDDPDMGRKVDQAFHTTFMSSAVGDCAEAIIETIRMIKRCETPMYTPLRQLIPNQVKPRPVMKIHGIALLKDNGEELRPAPELATLTQIDGHYIYHRPRPSHD
jgi:hypothetical protein